MSEKQKTRTHGRDVRATGEKPSSADILRWGSAFLLVAAVFLLASAGVELFPFWDLDPGRQWVPITGITPALTLILSTIPMLAAAGAMLSASLESKRVLWGQALLGAAGSAGVVAHGLLHGPAGLEHLIHGAPWVGAIGAWVAAAQLSTNRQMRSLLLALAAGFVMMLLSKGALQVFVEHPATMTRFQQNRDVFFASKGWTQGSPSALAYERRLNQAEATGWFGLSNVYASFAAAAMAGLAAACAAAWRRDRRWSWGLLAGVVGTACGAGSLALSGSKGGAGAAVVALLVAAGLGVLLRARPGLAGRSSPWIGPAVIVGVLGMVAARGLIGESAGERSILFRAFYAVGALRIWSAHPLLGVGPAGFQDAYASAKPAISPETVVSPHSVLLDWVSTLGVFGLAWGAMLVWSARSLCATAVPAVRMDDAVPIEEHGRDGLGRLEVHVSTDRADVRFIVLVAAVVTVPAVYIERALATPEGAVVRLAGMAGWMAIALGVHGLLNRGSAMRWLALASGLALLAHAQIEVTPVWVNAAMLFGMWTGLACSPGEAERGASRGGVWLSRFLTVVWVLLPVVMLGLGLPRVWRWESRLAEAAEVMRPVSELHSDLQSLSTGYCDVTPDGIATRLSLMLSYRVPPRSMDLGRGIDQLRAARLPGASAILRQAVSERPGHDGTRSAAGKLLLEQASRVGATAPAVTMGLLEAAISLAEEGTTVNPESVVAWDWLGVTIEQAASVATGSGRGDSADLWRERAWEAWIEVDRLSPYSVRPAIRMMDLAPLVGRQEASPIWAAEVLRRDELTRLDPLMGLSVSQRARVSGIAEGGPPGP